MSVLVTLDDMGISPAVNEAAVQCLAAGTVGCLSLLATGSAFDAAAEIAAVAGKIVSVHLNCVEPPFLTEGLNPPGSLAGWAAGSRRMSPEVASEWRAQIEKVLSSGLMVTRLDSHQHLHHLPGLNRVILELAGEYGIGSVRAALLPDRWLRPAGPLLNLLGRRLSSMASAAGISTPAMMLGFSCSGRLTMEYLTRWGKKLPAGSETELVTHPAVVPVWSELQPAELALLRSGRFLQWLNRA
jgi:chitin disaccharide deacetylase